MNEKQETIERLQALELRSGGSHEMLSSIAKAIYEPTYGGWTIGACQVLRDTLVRLLSEADTTPSDGGHITDELRKWARDNTVQDKVLTTYPEQHPVHGTVESLLRIADRIDAAHERAMADAELAAAPTEAQLEELGYIALPKDADGEYIHVGDRMESGDGDVFVVSSVDYGRHSSRGDGEFWMLWSDDAGFYERADECRHHKQPTVEDVLREFAQQMNENMGMYTGEAIDADEWRQADSKTIAEYAAKLREIRKAEK